MPAKKKKTSAVKALRQSHTRQQRNRSARTRIKTVVTSAREALAAADERMAESVKAAARVLDKAASKGVIRSNTASRRKSRLMRRLGAKAAPAATPPPEAPEPSE